MIDKILQEQSERLTEELAKAPENISTQLFNYLFNYLYVLKKQKIIHSNASVVLGEPYVIEGYHLTKQGFAIEHQKGINSGTRSEVLTNDGWLSKLSGPHRSRRILHKQAKRFLRGERQPVELNIQPTVPLTYFSITIEATKKCQTLI